MIEAVKQWAFTLVITAVLGNVAMSLTVSENSKNIKKYVKFACAVVALIVMVSPLRGLFQVLPALTNQLNNISSEIFEDGEYSGEEFESMSRINGLIIEKTSEMLKDRISVAIYQKTGIKPANIYIYIKQKDNINSGELQTDVIIEKVEITVPENIGENMSKEIDIYLKELLQCDIVILPQLS